MARLTLATFIAAAALLAAAPPARCAQDITAGAPHSASSEGAGHDGTLDHAGTAIARGARETGHAVRHAAVATGHAIGRGARATGHAISHAASATGHAIKRGVHKLSSSEPAASGTGH